VMSNQELSSESGYSITNEMFSFVTGQTPGTPKSSDDVLKNKPGHCIYREIYDQFYFIPVGEIVCRNDDITYL
jgi:hypothetical protein